MPMTVASAANITVQASAEPHSRVRLDVSADFPWKRSECLYAQHLVREVAALEATLAVHDDPSIADGTLVQFDLPVVLAEAEAAE